MARKLYVKEWRGVRGLSQLELANRCGVRPATICEIEKHGIVRTPIEGPSYLVRIAKVLRISQARLWEHPLKGNGSE